MSKYIGGPFGAPFDSIRLSRHAVAYQFHSMRDLLANLIFPENVMPLALNTI